MMKIRNSRRGQSSLEYAVYSAVILGVIISMMLYFKRGVQGRWKEAADSVGDQFSPEYATGTTTTTRSGTTSSNIFASDGGGGMITLREDTANITDSVAGSLTVGAE